MFALPLEEQLKKFITGMRKQTWVSFLTALIVGFVAHFYVMANRFINVEDINNAFVPRVLTLREYLPQGRWGSYLVQKISSDVTMTQVAGVFAILFMALSIALIVALFKLESYVYTVLFSAICMTFPGVASFYSYAQQVDSFAIAFFFSILAVYLFIRTKRGFLPAIICLAFSIGIYQIFLAVVVAILYIVLFFKLYEEKAELKVFFKEVLRSVVFLLASFVLYYLILQILLFATNTQMISYHGMDEMISFSIQGLMDGLRRTYVVFILYFFSDVYAFSKVFACLHILAILILAVAILKKLAMFAKEKRYMHIAAIVVMLMLLPVGFNSLPFLLGEKANQGMGTTRYMLYSFNMLYLFYILFLEKKEEAFFSKEKRNYIMQTVAVLPLIIAIYCGYIICNQAYARMNLVYESVYSYMTRITARIEMIPEWQEGAPVYFANCDKIFNGNYKVSIPEMDDLDDMQGTYLQTFYEQWTIENYLRIYLHFPIVSPSKEEMERINSSGDFTNMPMYPSEDAIQYVDGVIVVKMDE